MWISGLIKQQIHLSLLTKTSQIKSADNSMKGKERLIHEKTALFLCKGDPKMYIDITIDLKHYNGSVFDLRLSDYHPVKK